MAERRSDDPHAPAPLATATPEATRLILAQVTQLLATVGDSIVRAASGGPLTTEQTECLAFAHNVVIGLVELFAAEHARQAAWIGGPPKES